MNMSGAYQNPIYNQQMQQYGQQFTRAIRRRTRTQRCMILKDT